LYKEINDIATEKPSRPSNTISEYEPSVDATSTNRWSTIVSKRPYSRNKARKSDNRHNNQSMENANRYTLLPNLPETPICQEENGTPRFTEVTPVSPNNYVKKKNYRRRKSMSYSSPKECHSLPPTKPSRATG
jgi:hypothetical protein